VREKPIQLWLLITLCLIIIGSIGYVLIRFFGEQTWCSSLAYLVVASAIASGGCIAYHHLRIIQGTERASVLTNLDACWSDVQLANSRSEFLRFSNELENVKDSPEWQTEVLNKLKSYKIKHPDIYRKLVSMLDFYETLGYFCRVHYILPSDALELYGPSIKEYDKLFRGYILEFQEAEQDKAIYENFIWLADELRKRHN